MKKNILPTKPNECDIILNQCNSMFGGKVGDNLDVLKMLDNKNYNCLQIKIKDEISTYNDWTFEVLDSLGNTSLYNNKEEYVDVALIPDFNTSVMMNKLFRNIKENSNLDALEESDDEAELWF